MLVLKNTTFNKHCTQKLRALGQKLNFLVKILKTKEIVNLLNFLSNFTALGCFIPIFLMANSSKCFSNNLELCWSLKTHSNKVYVEILSEIGPS